LKVEDIAKIIANVRKKLKNEGIIINYPSNLAKMAEDKEFFEYKDSIKGKVGVKVEDAFIMVTHFGQVEVVSVNASVKKKVEKALADAGLEIWYVKVM